MKRWISWDCHDCGAKEGEIHKYGCDMEKCPFCGNQLIGCGCCEKKLSLDVSPESYYYLHGFTDEQSEQWREILEKKGRILYLLVPNMCGLCGQQWPEMWEVSDYVWKKYVPPQLQPGALCKDCFSELRRIFPHGWKAGGKKLVGRG